MAQVHTDTFRHKVEAGAVVMGGLTMASVLRCLKIGWDVAPMGRTTSESILLAAMWAPLAAFLFSIASSRYASYRSHAFAWWWIVLARGTITVCDALLCVCAANVNALYVQVWLRYFISGLWFGVGGWIPSLLYLLWSSGPISVMLAAIYEFLSFARVLSDLKCIASAAELYFAAVIVLLAQEDWSSAVRVLFGVGTGLCAGAMLLTSSERDVYDRVFSRLGMSHLDYQAMTQSLHSQAICLALTVFGLHLLGRFVKRV